MKLACQEHLLPGNSLIEKWEAAKMLGFAGIELRGAGNFAFRERLPDLRAAKRAGAVFPTVCVSMSHFIGDFDQDKRKDAIENMKSLLSIISELGGLGAITPAAYGMHTNNLPPYTSKRTAEEDRKVLLEGLHQLGEHATKEGVVVLFEPLNRYEDHMCNKLAQGVEICTALNLPSVKLIADTYHMNIEERNLSAALENSIAHLAHIHLSDSNRYEPGQGHIDFAGVFETLERLNYKGYFALECRLSAEPLTALKHSVLYLNKAK